MYLISIKNLVIASSAFLTSVKKESLLKQDRNIIFGQIFHPILNDGTVSILPSRDPKDENKLQCIKILHMFTFSNAICRGKLEGYTLTVDDRVVLEFQSGNSKRGLSKEKQKEPRKRPEDLIKEIREQKKYPDTFDIYYKNQKWVRWQKKPFSTDNNPIDYFERHTLEETEVVGGLRTRFKRPDYNDSFPSLNFLKPHEVAGDRKFWDHWNHIILLAGYDAAQDALKIGSGQKNLTPASRSIPSPEECVFLGSDVWKPRLTEEMYEHDKPMVKPDKLMWDTQVKFERNAILQNLADSLASDKFQALFLKYPRRQKKFVCGCSSKSARSYWIECVSHDNKDEMEIRFCPNCGKKVDTQIIDYVITNQTNPELAKNVNHYLSEDLLIDKGYQLEVETAWLTDDDNLFNPEKWPALDENAKGLEDLIEMGEISGAVPAEEYRQIRPLLRILIKDAQGNQFNFEDIGSGVAYMLPVIISGCDKTNSIKFIQQPELHIHPGLQSNLANIFTDTFENSLFTEKKYINFECGPEEFEEIRCSEQPRTSQFIIETHSEHFILRLLKLIKNSKKRKATRGIKPENVALLYFHPDPIKNDTKIKRIRISEDGGFVDHWPNGFFTERYQDIFDEKG